MIPGATIRAASPSDSSSLAELRLAFKQEDDPGAVRDAQFATRLEQWFSQRLGDGSWLAWVAELDGRIVGHVLVCLIDRVPSPSGDSAPLGYVTNFYVAPGIRNRGIGASLLGAVTANARSAKLNTLVAWPSEESDSIYRRAGFERPADLLELPL